MTSFLPFHCAILLLEKNYPQFFLEQEQDI
jgi:hypothetical protein